MADSMHIPEGKECEPFAAEARSRGCKGCAPVMVLTNDEELILGKMRDLKQEVRPIADRLKEIERFLGRGSDPQASDFGEEWRNLSGELERLRDQWKNWENSLDEAIERKLIMLGHRLPTT